MSVKQRTNVNYSCILAVDVKIVNSPYFGQLKEMYIRINHNSFQRDFLMIS